MTLPIALQVGGGRIHDVTFVPESDTVITAGTNGTIKHWDVSPPSPIGEFSGHITPVTCLSVVEEHGELLSGGTDCTVAHWIIDSRTRTERYRSHSDSVVDLAISPGCDEFATASWDGTARLWRFGQLSSKTVLVEGQAPMTSVDFAETGGVVATAGAKDRAEVWESSSGTQIAQISIDAPEIRHVRFLPGTDDLLVVGSNGTLKLLDRGLSTVKFTNQLIGSGDLPIAITPDARRLFVGWQRGVREVDLMSGDIQGGVSIPVTDVSALDVSSDGESLAVASTDGELQVIPLH